MVPPPFQTTEIRPRQGYQPSARLTNTGARREAPDPGDSKQPVHPQATTSGDRFRQEPRIAAVPADQYGSPAATRRASGSTDPRNSARSVPAPSARTKQGANRMTGVVTRDSARRRQIASIGRMRVAFLQHIPTACHNADLEADRSDHMPPMACLSETTCGCLVDMQHACLQEPDA